MQFLEDAVQTVVNIASFAQYCLNRHKDEMVCFMQSRMCFKMKTFIE